MATRTNIPITPTGLFIDLAHGVREFCCDVGSYRANNNTCLFLGEGSVPFGFSYGKNYNSTANLTESATAQIVTITASGNSSTSSTTTTTSMTGKLATVGAGVSVPLVLALMGVLFLLYREKKAEGILARRISTAEEDKRA
ncbi:uncharacterized protein BDZ99DRAFT_473335 [Mytilinidion resinicola]|uniref:Uncharacterized protein n=1 Tax=Mytilinidion resinicola TaxID=574789 RepID=A0A6A6Z0J1_9PEZI|nr:uncharacterized protein BDZ99DRAFT_473335 [Mytilinidion resinicola]KAF2814239.1 hypothetical protein BDZ99DRAFT_473335 [Mytilinidion resinicola]